MTFPGLKTSHPTSWFSGATCGESRCSPALPGEPGCLWTASQGVGSGGYVLLFSEECLWFCTCGWEMSYLASLALCEVRRLRFSILHLVVSAEPVVSSAGQMLVILRGAWVRQHIPHTHRYAHGGLGWAECQRVGWVHDVFSFETIATTAKQILELELKYISSNKHLSLFPDLSQKSFKRKRSIINWAFWRGPGTHLDNAPLSSTSAAPGKLFGLLLTTICEDDNLPKPLLVSPRLRAGSCSGGISLCSEQEHGDTL